jgi:hypothetical protein
MQRLTGQGKGRRRSISEITSLCLSVLISLILLLSSVRLLSIEAAVPPSVWLSSLRTFRSDATKRALTTETYRESLGKLFPAPDLLHDRYAECVAEKELAVAGKSFSNLINAWKKCLGALDLALASNPAAGDLWVERAFAIGAIGGAEKYVWESLRFSHQFAPLEGWVISKRLPLLLSSWSSLPNDLRSSALTDIDTMLSSWNLTGDLAQFFRDYPFFRNRLMTLIEDSMVRGGKERFVNAVASEAIEEGRPLRVATIKILAGGEAYRGPPEFLLFADQKVIARVVVQTTVDPTTIFTDKPSRVAAAMGYYIYSIPNIETVKTIGIEYVNDSWAGEGKLGDRNLWIKDVSVDGVTVPLEQLVIQAKVQQIDFVDEMVLFAANGKLEISRPKLGWPTSSWDRTD